MLIVTLRTDRDQASRLVSPEALALWDKLVAAGVRVEEPLPTRSHQLTGGTISPDDLIALIAELGAAGYLARLDKAVKTRAASQRPITSAIAFPPGSPIEAVRQLLPATAGAVYVLSDDAGRALYVGQTRTPGPRLRRHSLTQDWWPRVARIELHLVADPLARRVLEEELTVKLAPAHSQITDLDRAHRRILAGGR